MSLEKLTRMEFLRKIVLAGAGLVVLAGIGGIGSLVAACIPKDSNTHEEEPNPIVEEETVEVEEPEYVKSLDILSMYNPELVDFLKEQPWYKDGINRNEEIFILHGLGTTPLFQGVGKYKTLNDALKKIVENEQYKIETVQLNGGLKNILVMCENEEKVKTYMEAVKQAVPIVENYLGITYPYETLTIITVEDLGSYFEGAASNGTIRWNERNPREVGPLAGIYHELVHALFNTNTEGRRGGSTRAWIEEGMAEVSVLHGLTQINEEGYTKKRFNSWEYQAKYYNLWDNATNGLKPVIKTIEELGIPDMSLEERYARYYPMGALFMKELYETMGSDAYTKMLSDLYNFKAPFDRFAVDVDKLEETALLNAPNKKAVSDLFALRVYGK